MRVYDRNFYEKQGQSIRSASIIVPLLIDLIRPTSVIDVGCGLGTWLHVFHERGVQDILGIDGEWINQQQLQFPKDRFAIMDLSRPSLQVGRQFDLALCLEVAEHLSESSAQALITSLTNVAPVVYFSAAVPGQGGANHVNEQWPDYWMERFAQREYRLVDAIRPRIWNTAEVEPWYCQNSFIYLRQAQIDQYPDLFASTSVRPGFPLRVIHPDLFRRFVELEHVRSKQMIFTLYMRLKRRLLRNAKS